MDTRRIGSLDVSIIGLGCNNFGSRLDATATNTVVHAALDVGITLFDTADIYGGTKCEEFLGRALGAHRHDVVVATKFGKPVDPERQGAHPKYIRQAVEDSLRRLGTDYIDLYQLHAPDPSVPIEDTLGALNELVQAGKVREIGCSNFSADEIRSAEAAVRPGAARFVSVQNEYSLLHREVEQEVLPTCESLGIAFLPYYPLLSGLLTGKYRRGKPLPSGTRLKAETHADRLAEENLDLIERLIQFSGDRGHTILELAIAYLLYQPAVASVIAGATKAEQVTVNARATVWTLTADDVAQVNKIVEAAPVVA